MTRWVVVLVHNSKKNKLKRLEMNLQLIQGKNKIDRCLEYILFFREYPQGIRLLIIGDRGVGKMTLLHRFIKQEEEGSTIGYEKITDDWEETLVRERS